jgi:phosphoglycolate phosphatase-like HAD superfamily hydrolase
VAPLPGASELVRRLSDLGHSVVLASSAKEDEVEHYVDLLGVRELADSWTTSDDVERTKPAPDLVHSALERSSKQSAQASGGAVMLGDSIYDCQAAGRAAVPSLGVLTGGFSREELREAGAGAVYESPAEVLKDIGDTPFG